MAGYTIRHALDRNCVRLVPIMSKPIPVAPNHIVPICPTGHVHHPVKTLHLWLGPAGECMISEGVLELLQGRVEGMDGFVLESVTDKPPPLRVGRNGDRAQVDNVNRKQHVYGSELIVPKKKRAKKRKAPANG